MQPKCTSPLGEAQDHPAQLEPDKVGSDCNQSPQLVIQWAGSQFELWLKVEDPKPKFFMGLLVFLASVLLVVLFSDQTNLLSSLIQLLSAGG